MKTEFFAGTLVGIAMSAVVAKKVGEKTKKSTKKQIAEVLD